MLPLAQLNYLLRHSGANRTAGSADLKAPFQCFTRSATGHGTGAAGRRRGSVALPAAMHNST